MVNSRRTFIKKATLTGLVTMSASEIISSAEPFERGKGNEKNKGLTFLFQGDSITDGNRSQDNDWNHVMGHGYAYLIASRLWYDYTQQDLMFYNRGISGNRVRDLKARWQQDALDLKPDVLSILIGINDVLATLYNHDPEPIEKFEENYLQILEETKKTLPDTQIVLCEPFLLPVGRVSENPVLWETEVEKQQKLVRKLAKTYDAIFVELQEPFEKACKRAPASYWIWDGIHPMPAGHELVARQWIKAVSKKFPFITPGPCK